jgi:hypothetical protein
MALLNFPAYIHVRLGAYWAGGGSSGLTSGQDLTLQIESQSGSIITYTETGSPTPDTSTNKLKLVFNSPGHLPNPNWPREAEVFNINMGGGWDNMFKIREFDTTVTNYSFLDIFNGGTTVYKFWNTMTGFLGGIGTSWQPWGTSSNYTRSAMNTPGVWFNGNTFSVLEVGEAPPGPGLAPDKTTYRYG